MADEDQRPTADRASPADLLSTVSGLAPDLVRAYRVIVSASSLDAEQLAGALDVGRATADHLFEELHELGYVTALAQSSTRPTAPRYVATPPAISLGPAVAAQEEAIRGARSELGRLEELYRVVRMEGGGDDFIQIVRGADTVAQWFTRVQAGARHEVCALVQHPVAVTTASQNDIEDELVARGVRYRVILERAMMEEHYAGLDDFATSLAAGEEARVMESLPLRMVVVDRELAFMPVLSDRDRAFAAAMIVRPSSMLTGLVALFDLLWSTATPVVLAADLADPQVGVMDDLDARLLSLLLAGHTDESTAAHLEVSLRTVQRRVRVLLDRAAVRTRIQLGWHAARAGWHADTIPARPATSSEGLGTGGKVTGPGAMSAGGTSGVGGGGFG